MLREILYSEAVASAALDGQTFVIYPPSTMIEPLDGARIRWWHPETCTVLSGRCSCLNHPIGEDVASAPAEDR